MNMLGINLDCISYEDMYRILTRWLKDKTTRSHRLAVVNVHICVSSLFNKKLRDMYNSADLIGIDSMPFTKWARASTIRKRRSEMHPTYFACQQQGKRKKVLLFPLWWVSCSTDNIEKFLKSRYEGVNIVGKYSPPFRPLTQEEDDDNL